MASFEVIHCHTEVTYFQKKRVVDKEGSLHIRQIEMTKPVKAGFYGVEDVKVGDVIQLTGVMAEKARNNPDLKEVAAKKKVSKKK